VARTSAEPRLRAGSEDSNPNTRSTWHPVPSGIRCHPHGLVDADQHGILMQARQLTTGIEAATGSVAAPR
jgi:hypothetical protein